MKRIERMVTDFLLADVGVLANINGRAGIKNAALILAVLGVFTKHTAE